MDFRSVGRRPGRKAHTYARAAGGGVRAARSPRPGRRARVLRRRRYAGNVLRSLLAVLVLLGGYVGVTIYPYLTAPGTDRVAARVAEWGRDHHLSWAVSWLENATYTPPPVGGALSARQRARLRGPKPPPPSAASSGTLTALPTDIAPLAAGSVPGEGVWRAVTTDPAGAPIVEQTALRPDAQHTSALAYAVWMNHKALRFQLHPGYQQPGGNWSMPDTIAPTQRAGLVATWNGGFKLKPDDALGGYYADGHTAVALRAGKAAEVFYRDGSIKIGMWGRDETMTPNVAGVRQNLNLLVDRGKVAASLADGSSAQWGLTIKNWYYVARSGIGMTAAGDIVYVSGPQLSVYTLARLLQAAGCVYAMELDINPDWVSFMTYDGAASDPTAHKLWNFIQPANRYLQPSDRDFVAVYRR